MLTHERLVELYRELRDEHVLSVYLDAEEHDPAQRKSWRRRLDHQLTEVRRDVEENGSTDERDALTEAVSRIEEELSEFDAFLPDKGWVGFATPDQIWYAQPVPVPMPDLARWEKGIRVAPYVRGLKQDRPVVLVLVDSQRARVFRYQDGRLEEPEALRADIFVGDLSDVGVRKLASQQTGVRGETSTDQAQRILEVSTERMLKQLMEVLSEMAGGRGFLVIGGTPEMVRRAAADVPKSLSDRVLERPSLHFDMSVPEVREAAETAATELTRRVQESMVEDLVDAALSGGRACLGREETERALQEMRVDTLFLSRDFIDRDPDFADRCVGSAFAQDARVEELSAAAAERLGEEGGGIGARLRFKIRQNGGGEA